MVQQKKATMLLYACCGPCACSVFENGYQNFYDITIFFFGSHLDSEQEYFRRLEAVNIVNEKLNNGRKMIIHPYNPSELNNDIDEKVNTLFPTDEHRCMFCIFKRLSVAASAAFSGKFDSFATSLTVSPHKDTALVNSIGKDISNQCGIRFVDMNLKKNDGFKKSVTKSKELGLYRQNYCGCAKSVR